VKLIGIATRAEKRAALFERNEATITIEAGLAGDSRSRAASSKKDAKRAITILSADSWQDVCQELNTELPWTIRRANLCVEGMRFGRHHVGQQVHFKDYDGHSLVVLEITGETEPCERMDEAFPGLRAALARDWRGGITCRVIKSNGLISRGNRFSLETPVRVQEDTAAVY
jgi:MOSC domain-containing protein YiiM